MLSNQCILLQLAKHITRSRGCRVSWVTPLGLPVVQPYVKQSEIEFDLWSGSNTSKTEWVAALTRAARRIERQCMSSGSLGSRDSLVGLPPPNPVKQRNAFPPNFIHSLDSCHMMLTALHCLREGVMFASVHDCFWTHAASVDTLNRVSPSKVSYSKALKANVDKRGGIETFFDQWLSVT